ncbi:hypothetical protein [Salibacterium qingdaonense]|uniref:hypothetical protein n=1 Tax=Salibacterium qingdaonense TaxID=266892 RepID=UPI0015A65923|nr:hypothetical protein [Salibacterium qingdaonense]
MEKQQECSKCDVSGVMLTTCDKCGGETTINNSICMTCFGNGFIELDCDACDDSGVIEP